MWQDKPVFIQLLLFIMVVILCFLISSFIGAVLLIPLFDINIFETSDILNQFEENVNALNALKFMQVINATGLFILPAFIFTYLTKKSNVSFFNLTFHKNPYSYIFVIFMVVIASPVITWIHEINQQMTFPTFLKSLEDWMRSAEADAEKITMVFLKMDSNMDFIVTIFIVAILSAMGEELLFRGVLQRLFQQWTGNNHLAIMITSLLFSAIHFQFYGFIPRFLLGLLLGYLFFWSGSLWIPVLAHFINNSFAVTMNYLYQIKIIGIDMESIEFAPATILSSTVILTMLIYLFYKRYRIIVVENTILDK